MEVIKYLRDVKAEVKNVKWPTSKTTTYFTVGVLTISAMCAVYLWALDLTFTELLNRFVL